MGRLAEICPVGIFVGDGHGKLTFVNDTWVSLLSEKSDDSTELHRILDLRIRQNGFLISIQTTLK